MQSSFLEPELSDAQIEMTLREHNANFERLTEHALLDRTARALASGEVGEKSSPTANLRAQ